ncbi:MAG: DUF2946 family protein [Hyphomicrobium sp.]|nr:hypothetical protein [Hyphomicrobium sp.]
MKASLWLSRLLIVAFALRALIPVGYMPDFASVASGSLKVVICTASGTQTVYLNLDGSPPAPQHKSGADEQCAFSGIATATLPEVTAEPIHWLTAESPAIAVPRPSLHPIRAGPVLGSRGPPMNS